MDVGDKYGDVCDIHGGQPVPCVGHYDTGLRDHR